jgi:hypothetical protein
MGPQHWQVKQFISAFFGLGARPGKIFVAMGNRQKFGATLTITSLISYGEWHEIP